MVTAFLQLTSPVMLMIEDKEFNPFHSEFYLARKTVIRVLCPPSPPRMFGDLKLCSFKSCSYLCSTLGRWQKKMSYTGLLETIVRVLTTFIHNTLEIGVYIFFYLTV